MASAPAKKLNNSVNAISTSIMEMIFPNMIFDVCLLVHSVIAIGHAQRRKRREFEVQLSLWTGCKHGVLLNPHGVWFGISLLDFKSISCAYAVKPTCTEAQRWHRLRYC